MSNTEAVGEGKVSGNQASIPAHIRRQVEIEDGDMLRWKVIDGNLQVEIVRQQLGVFDDFEPGASDEPIDGVAEHDAFGLEEEQEREREDE
jgi:bifunctional DNA-binding transcriptional regulator/antitoxin component of YhaV-PrlF toxin-antitoxin module